MSENKLSQMLISEPAALLDRDDVPLGMKATGDAGPLQRV